MKEKAISKQKNRRVLGSMRGTAEILGDIVGPIMTEKDWCLDGDLFKGTRHSRSGKKKNKKIS